MWNTDLAKNFRKVRGQMTVSSDDDKVIGIPEKKHKAVKKGGDYERFLYKYDRLEETCDSFTTKDLCYFFREKAKEAGSKYVIANMKRDMGIFKNLIKDFSVPEILLMIEFIFSGEKTYLDIYRTQPTVLASSWVNTIYRDSIDWVNDCYIDKKTMTNKNTSKREWKSSKNKTKIGEWE